jgi:hypothetical protein
MINYKLHHVNGLYFELVDDGGKNREYDISFVDKAFPDKPIYETKLKTNSWSRLERKFLSDIAIYVRFEGRTIKQINILDEIRGKKVFISFESKALGDTLAWMPYCLEFAKHYECKVVVSTFKNFLFEKVYPELEFVERGVSVNNIIQTALEGSVVNTFYENDRRYDITVRLEADYRNSIDAISTVQIPLPGKNIGINLGDIADIRSMQGSARINREMGTRNSSVKANIIGRDQGGFVREAQAAVKKNIQLPPGYYITWGGQFENQHRAVKRLQFIIPITVLLIFSLLFWAFRSIRKALLVLLIIPFSMIGGIAGLALAGLHFSVSSAVGFIAVAGVSVQNGVIMVKRINEILLTEKVIIDGAIEGAVSRLRPIVMTALMACLGLLPSALSHGIGSETQRPFAVVIVGGILTATLVTLILLPLVFPYFQNKEITTDPFSK